MLSNCLVYVSVIYRDNSNVMLTCDVDFECVVVHDTSLCVGFFMFSDDMCTLDVIVE